MIHHYNHEILVVVVHFTVSFYHFSFSRYLELAERLFSFDILVPFPDAGVLYSSEAVFLLLEHYSPRGVKQKKHVKKRDILAFKPLLQEIWLKNQASRKLF